MKLEIELPEELEKEYISYCFIAGRNIHLFAKQMLLEGLITFCGEDFLFKKMKRLSQQALENLQDFVRAQMEQH